MIKKIAGKILNFSARIAVKRNNYKIVAVTGSVGKTSTKKAIASVLSSQYKVLSSDEGYNTELGLPLILLEKSVPKNNIGWFLLIITSPFLAMEKRDYDFCVLEMGADKPGDIEYLTRVAKPDIAVVTNVSAVHLEKFADIHDIAKEKAKILSKLQKGEIAVINSDDKYVTNMPVSDGVRRITFGKGLANVKIIGQDFTAKGSVNRFNVDGKYIKIQSISSGEHILYVFAAAIAVGISQKIELDQIVSLLESFRPARGRLNIIEGLNSSTIIDDSYNANPASMKNALDVLNKFHGGRKVAVLGTMGELGKYEKESHEEIGAYLVGKCDILVVVGELAEKYLLPVAVRAGMKKENTFSFSDSLKAGEFMKGFLEKGDVVLAKGSQNKVRLERAVKMIMSHPEDASKLLCRQGKEWEKRS